MRNYLSVLFFLCATLTIPTFATSINVTTQEQTYTNYASILEDKVAVFEEEGLEVYLGKSLECRNVKLQFNNIRKPSALAAPYWDFGKKGLFSISLTAECNKKFKDIKFEIERYSETGDGPFLQLKISYILNGKLNGETFSDYPSAME